MRAIVDSNVIISALDPANPNHSLANAILGNFSSWVIPSFVLHEVEIWAERKGLKKRIELLKHEPRVEILDISNEEAELWQFKPLKL